MHLILCAMLCVCDLILHLLLILLHNVGITAEFLYWIMWEAVRRLEEIGLKVAKMCFVYNYYLIT